MSSRSKIVKKRCQKGRGGQEKVVVCLLDNEEGRIFLFCFFKISRWWEKEREGHIIS